MKNGKNKAKAKVSNKPQMDDEVAKLIKIVVAVVVIFTAFYLITSLVTDEKKLEEKNDNKVEIQYKEILLGNLLKQAESEYYVLVTFENDKYNPLYNSYFAQYEKKDNSLSVYNVNINNAFNEKYISEESKMDISNLKFKEVTLLKIKSDNINEVYEGRKKVVEVLEKIID